MWARRGTGGPVPRQLPPKHQKQGGGRSGSRALTVIIVGDHVAIPVVRRQGRRQRLQRRLCGGRRQGWAQSPRAGHPSLPQLSPSYRSSPWEPPAQAQAARPSPPGAPARPAQASSCWGVAGAASGAGCTQLRGGRALSQGKAPPRGRWGREGRASGWTHHRWALGPGVRIQTGAVGSYSQSS